MSTLTSRESNPSQQFYNRERASHSTITKQCVHDSLAKKLLLEVGFIEEMRTTRTSGDRDVPNLVSLSPLSATVNLIRLTPYN